MLMLRSCVHLYISARGVPRYLIPRLGRWASLPKCAQCSEMGVKQATSGRLWHPEHDRQRACILGVGRSINGSSFPENHVLAIWHHSVYSRVGGCPLQPLRSLLLSSRLSGPHADAFRLNEPGHAVTRPIGRSLEVWACRPLHNTAGPLRRLLFYLFLFANAGDYDGKEWNTMELETVTGLCAFAAATLDKLCLGAKLRSGWAERVGSCPS